jgi:hypothetical protein
MIGAAAAAGVITLGVMTTAGGPQGAPERAPSEELAPAEYQEKLVATCRAAQEKLERKRGANPDALPLEDLVVVLQEQLHVVDRLGAPADLAGTHDELVAATRGRITLLEQALSADTAEDQVGVLLSQADVAAEQMHAAYEGLGVPAECAE